MGLRVVDTLPRHAVHHGAMMTRYTDCSSRTTTCSPGRSSVDGFGKCAAPRATEPVADTCAAQGSVARQWAFAQSYPTEFKPSFPYSPCILTSRCELGPSP